MAKSRCFISFLWKSANNRCRCLEDQHRFPDPVFDVPMPPWFHILVPKTRRGSPAGYDECAHYVRDYDQLLWRITNSLPRFASDPAYSRIKGQPVWFVYQVWDDWLTPAQAQSYVTSAEKTAGYIYWIFDKLKTIGTTNRAGARMLVPPEWLKISNIDCFGTYSYFGHWRDTRPETITELYTNFVREVHQAGKSAQHPCSPGHDNTPVSDDSCLIPRNEGATLGAFLRRG